MFVGTTISSIVKESTSVSATCTDMRCVVGSLWCAQVLRGVSIHIKPGESVAVVGASGSGKSTILKLATRLYDAASGSVKVNGVDVRELTTESLRAAVAVVPQDTVLFNDTILQNIRCELCRTHQLRMHSVNALEHFLILSSHPLLYVCYELLYLAHVRHCDAWLRTLRCSCTPLHKETIADLETVACVCRYGKPTATDDEVIAAAKLAHLHDAVLRMPEGYKTMVGERGLKLSGGEKQRVAIARAFLRAPRLLICDEATSALDTATEASILSSLDELARVSDSTWF